MTHLIASQFPLIAAGIAGLFMLVLMGVSIEDALSRR
jgi:hypothetical protein